MESPQAELPPDFEQRLVAAVENLLSRGPLGYVLCPADPVAADGTVHTVIGCNTWVPDVRDDEGLVDCPNCGMWFDPNDERRVR